jgi:hypothetical protein
MGSVSLRCTWPGLPMIDPWKPCRARDRGRCWGTIILDTYVRHKATSTSGRVSGKLMSTDGSFNVFCVLVASFS